MAWVGRAVSREAVNVSYMGWEGLPMPSNKQFIHTKRFYEPVFRASVVLAVGEGNEWCRKNIDAKATEGCNGYAGSFTEEDGLTGYYIWVRQVSFADLAHEAVHLVNNIFSDRGIRHTPDNDEAFAYYVGYWIDQFSKELFNKYKKRSK